MTSLSGLSVVLVTQMAPGFLGCDDKIVWIAYVHGSGDTGHCVRDVG